MARVPGTYRTIAVVAAMTGMIVPYPVSEARTAARLVSAVVVADAGSRNWGFGTDRVARAAPYKVTDQGIGPRHSLQDGFADTAH